MSKTTRKWAAGTALAGAVGYLAGILTAPKSGKETRKEIKDKAVEISGEAEERLKGLHKDLGIQSDKLKTYAKKLTGTAKDKADDMYQELEDARERARKAISALRAGDEDEIDEVIADLEKLKKTVTKRFSTAAKELKK